MSRITTPTDLLRELDRQGFTRIRGGSGHWKVSKRGRLITTVPSTPSDGHSLKNCISVLRKNGFDTGHRKKH